jgi:hypothetical protein
MYIQNISVTTGIFEDLRCKKMSRADETSMQLSSNTDLRMHTQGKWL